MTNKGQMHALQPNDFGGGEFERQGLHLCASGLARPGVLRTPPLPIRGRRSAEGALEGAREGLVAPIAAIERDLQNARFLNLEPKRGALQAEPRHITGGRLADLDLERAMEMRRRHAGPLAERRQTQVAVQVA